MRIMLNFFLSKRLLIILLATTFSGCSSLSNKTLIAGASSFVLCSFIGADNAPKGENKNMHGALYGGACSSVSMAIAEGYEAYSAKKSTLKNELNKEKELENKIRKSLSSSEFYKNIDDSLKEKLQKDWTAYKVDNWIYSDGKLFHENLEIQFKKGEKNANNK